MDKNVKNKFDDIAQKYDSQRQFLIPCFNDFYGIMVELTHSDIEKPRILDIGAGTGLLTKMIYQKYKNAFYTLIDLSDEMLSIAKKRFMELSNFSYINDNYLEYKFNKKFDIIVSALSIHHLDDKDKFKLYQKIFLLLNQGGIFINGDQVIGENDHMEKLNREKWIEKIELSPLSYEEKQSAYQRMKLDRMATLEKNIKFLNRSGFKNVDIFYKYYNFTVMYCRK